MNFIGEELSEAIQLSVLVSVVINVSVRLCLESLTQNVCSFIADSVAKKWRLLITLPSNWYRRANDEDKLISKRIDSHPAMPAPNLLANTEERKNRGSWYLDLNVLSPLQI